MEIVKTPDVQESTNNVDSAILEAPQAEMQNDSEQEDIDPQAELKKEYLAYVDEISKGRFNYDTQEKVIEAVNAISKILSLTTVVPRTELQTKGDTRQPVIIGGTHIDLVKSQYPGVYPILVQRLLDLGVKL
jgi:hypothetical protein